MAERGGFEPPVGFPTPAFQAGTLNHSATSPEQNLGGRIKPPPPGPVNGFPAAFQRGPRRAQAAPSLRPVPGRHDPPALRPPNHPIAAGRRARGPGSGRDSTRVPRDFARRPRPFLEEGSRPKTVLADPRRLFQPAAMRALVVDDDAKISSYVEKGLREAGFAVDTVANGADALPLARERALLSGGHATLVYVTRARPAARVAAA